MNVAVIFSPDVAFAPDKEQGAHIGDCIGEELKGSLHLRLDGVEHFAAACEAVVDAQGEVDVCKVAPIVGYGYIIDIRVREVIADKVIGAVVPAHIYAVVIFRFLLFLTCGECRVG